ncbi:MAG: hypothetical protein J6X39_04460 [Bacteroidales bacterium]|nr:hypothetical protein [Bacteroidales bacterium]
MGKKLFVVLIAAVVLASCSTSRYYSDYTQEDITEDLAILGPISSIVYMDKNNHRVYDDSLSIASEELFTKLTYQSGLPITARIELNEDQRHDALSFLSYLNSTSAKERGNVPIPQSLDYLLESSGHRYGLLLFEDGTVRDPKGVYKEVAVSAAIAILVAVITLGSIIMYSVPIANISNVYIAVIDSQEDNVVFYNMGHSDDTDPLNERALKSQLKGLYKKLLE